MEVHLAEIDHRYEDKGGETWSQRFIIIFPARFDKNDVQKFTRCRFTVENMFSFKANFCEVMLIDFTYMCRNIIQNTRHWAEIFRTTERNSKSKASYCYDYESKMS